MELFVHSQVFLGLVLCSVAVTGSGGDRACSQVVGAEVLKVGSELAPSPLSVFPPQSGTSLLPRRGAVPG